MKTILVDAVDAFIVENEDGSYGVDEQMREMLDGYDNPKVVVTNANKEERVEFGMDTIPDGYELYSLDHSPEKTDPEYFKRLLKEKDLGVNDVVYFEHNLDAVKSAKSLGIASFHYQRDLGALKVFLDSE